MAEQAYRCIGLMSGTSLDGLDLCCAHYYRKGEQWHYRIEAAETVDYDQRWQQRLRYNPHLTATALLQLDTDYGRYLGQMVLAFLKKHQLPGPVDLVASHGHTMYHQPGQGYTWQLGCGPELTAGCGLISVTDFRRADVAWGGQGAPLVPIGDALLFGTYDACLNLGGFANYSFDRQGERLATDITAVNYVLNHLAARLARDFDREGQLARGGRMIPDLRDKLEQVDHSPGHTGSLGAEWASTTLLPLLSDQARPEDLLHTYTRFAGRLIAQRLNDSEARTCLVTGGGTYNTFLVEIIREHFDGHLELPARELIDYKEALVFGLMGVLRLRGEVNVHRSVTGCRTDHSAGIIYRA